VERENSQAEYFVGDWGSKIYHLPDCSMMEIIIHKLRISSIIEAEGDGYAPHTCIPPSLSSLERKLVMNVMPSTADMNALISLGWQEIQAGNVSKWIKYRGKAMNDISPTDMQIIHRDLLVLGLKTSGKTVIE